MKKTKIVSLVMAITTVFSVSVAPVYAAETSNYDYDIMPISEVYDDYSTSLISEDDIMLISPNPNQVPDTISVVLNGETIDFTDENGNKVDPQLVNDRTMVPVRKIFEVLGATIEWDGATETVTAKTEEKVMKLQINNNVATVTTGDVVEEITLDAAPVVIDGRTLVPVRFISETLGLKVGWDQMTQTVIIFDTHIILEIIKEEAPTFYAMLTEESAPVKTGEVDMDMTMTLDYKNAEDKTQNSNVKMVVNGLVKVAEKAIGLDFDYKITGKGIVYDDMKSEDLDNMSMQTIVDIENPAVYVKSPMLETDKWVKEAYDDMEELDFDMSELQKEYENPEDRLQEVVDTLFELVELTPSTYDEAGMLTRLACKFISDDFFTVSGRTTKTYKYEISIKDVEEIISGMGIELGLDQIFQNTKLTFTAKYANGVNTEATFGITSKINMDYETIELDVDVNAVAKNINGNVKVEIPAEKDVMSIDEM